MLRLELNSFFELIMIQELVLDWICLYLFLYMFHAMGNYVCSSNVRFLRY